MALATHLYWQRRRVTRGSAGRTPWEIWRAEFWVVTAYFCTPSTSTHINHRPSPPPHSLGGGFPLPSVMHQAAHAQHTHAHTQQPVRVHNRTLKRGFPIAPAHTKWDVNSDYQHCSLLAPGASILDLYFQSASLCGLTNSQFQNWIHRKTTLPLFSLTKMWASSAQAFMPFLLLCFHQLDAFLPIAADDIWLIVLCHLHALGSTSLYSWITHISGPNSHKCFLNVSRTSEPAAAAGQQPEFFPFSWTMPLDLASILYQINTPNTPLASLPFPHSERPGQLQYFQTAFVPQSAEDWAIHHHCHSMLMHPSVAPSDQKSTWSRGGFDALTVSVQS